MEKKIETIIDEIIEQEPPKQAKSKKDDAKEVLDVITTVPTPDESIQLEEKPTEQAVELLKEQQNKDSEKTKFIRLKYRTKENDIKYQGPLTYRWLRILAWLSLAVAQIALVLKIATTLNPEGAETFQTISGGLSYVASLPLVLFMLANFGIILRNRNNFKYLFIFYGGVMLGLYALANLVVLHYVYGLTKSLDPETTFQSVAIMTGSFLGSIGTTGYIFNLFVDLFLCVVTVFFFFYKPKTKAFAGKKVILFRLLVILPIAYETISIIVKHGALLGRFSVPSYLFFLLTSKPPLTFLAFFVVTFIIKIREHKFLKKFNFDYALLAEQNSTRAHSFLTGITIAVVFSVVGILDTLAFAIYVVVQFINFGGDDLALLMAAQMANEIGLGGSIPLLFIAPLGLIYSYTKVHKNKKFDSFLPIIGIALIIFTIFEGIYLTLRINLRGWLDGIIENFAGMEGMEGLEGEGGEEPLEAIKHAINLFRIWK